MVGDILGGLGGALGSLGGFFGTDNGEKDLNEAIKIYGKLRTPGFDMSSLTPYELDVVGQYFPEVYEFAKPPSPETLGEGGAGRDAQMESLAKLQQYQDEGLPLLERLASDKANQEIQRQNQRNQQYALESMQQRGRAGGGMEMAARIAGNQQSADLANQLGSELQANSIKGRFAGTLAGADVGHSLEAQDMARQAQNAQIWNEWNKFMSLGLTDAAASQAAAKNQAALFNLQNAQDVSNQNTMLRNEYQQYNQQNQNALRQQGFGNELQKASGLADLYGQRSQRQDAAQAAATKTFGSLGQGLGQAAGGIYDFYAAQKPEEEKKPSQSLYDQKAAYYGW